jgi:hypothetical protein
MHSWPSSFPNVTHYFLPVIQELEVEPPCPSISPTKDRLVRDGAWH